jgi:hypothetical protein
VGTTAHVSARRVTHRDETPMRHRSERECVHADSSGARTLRVSPPAGSPRVARRRAPAPRRWRRPRRRRRAGAPTQRREASCAAAAAKAAARTPAAAGATWARVGKEVVVVRLRVRSAAQRRRACVCCVSAPRRARGAPRLARATPVGARALGPSGG